MPLEISEIGVRLAVGDPIASGPATQEPVDASQDAEPMPLSPAQVSAIVDRCVDAVLRTLRMLEAR